MDFKKSWTEESAMEILKHPTVDSKLWAEAAEWLMLYGSPKVKEMLLEASLSATHSCFPDLKPESYNENGEPCYNIAALAESLGLEEDEVRKIIAEKEKEHDMSHAVDQDKNFKIQ